MQASVILTVVGSDKPGLTERLADAVLAAGGNWLESHLAQLAGKYVGSILVELAPDRLAELEASTRAIDDGGLHVAIVHTGEVATSSGHAMQLSVVGSDRPGIVREVTSALAALGVNIDSFSSITENGSWSGERLFRASLKLRVPSGVAEDTVRQALEDVSGDIMVDFPSA